MYQHDWTKVYNSPLAAEADLNGFVFHGEGWYEDNDEDTLYIEYLEEDEKARRKDPRIRVYCWNRPDGREFVVQELAQLLLMPCYV